MCVGAWAKISETVSPLIRLKRDVICVDDGAHEPADANHHIYDSRPAQQDFDHIEHVYLSQRAGRLLHLDRADVPP